ncbi:hypothetical protein A2354_00515 [Candidatus Amesbacteria bacterium RIFOXYB1_FULL_47_12]|nr:MAG: hypothetical protein A2V48_02495 [Candidatus Amesbacteria bacterium RBG_19FT_COMBO_48_16]OGD01466.1 MAG: hypothetical protein A2354_00515 [Candidatus Amesbacteria bacterium RIFOXYB1_FULL_47_12]
MSVKKLARYWWPTLFWMGVIFMFSSRPVTPASQIFWQDFLIKKTGHFIAYFILAVLLYRSLKSTTRLSLTLLFLFTITLTIAYAATDEFHQSFTPGREPRLRDVAIDSLGAMTAVYFIFRRSVDLFPVL